jgi:hypothetical protein
MFILHPDLDFLPKSPVKKAPDPGSGTLVRNIYGSWHHINWQEDHMGKEITKRSMKFLVILTLSWGIPLDPRTGMMQWVTSRRTETTRFAAAAAAATLASLAPAEFTSWGATLEDAA